MLNQLWKIYNIGQTTAMDKIPQKRQRRRQRCPSQPGRRRPGPVRTAAAAADAAVVFMHSCSLPYVIYIYYLKKRCLPLCSYVSFCIYTYISYIYIYIYYFFENVEIYRNICSNMFIYTICYTESHTNTENTNS